ncbi:sentrin-specific protease 5-like isoform X2 [Cololabis saira]|uniref:sentrin-specific protease 5-like isoform X2 n=1 Tax=Cololabis saira TaxID=129043 RepID=UPI002AD2A677|nr:sentrin-specific protease 5-like isoform X2 [Cololabis saira]
MQQPRCRKAQRMKRRKGFMSSVKGVSHLSRRAKRRLYCKLQFWMWRKRREKSRFGILRSRRCTHNSLVRTSSLVSPLGCDAGGSEDAVRLHNGLPTQSEAARLSGALAGARCSQVTDANVYGGAASQTLPETTMLCQNGETWLRPDQPTGKLDHTAPPPQCTDSKACDGNKWCTAPRTQRLEVEYLSQHHSRNQNPYRATDETLGGKKAPSAQQEVDVGALTRDIQDFLGGFYRRYGSFIPLRNSDVLKHLRRKFNRDFSGGKTVIFSEVSRWQNAIIQRSVPCFRVVYKKHVLTLEDLLTLADQNWLNDQVMNMYGELIMESSHHELMTKGYDGVKRWTKQVDLFSKSLLLVPVHLEVHWCLVTANIATKKICLYDSQGNALQKVARNILKYLMTEAKEKQQTAFQDGWSVSFDEEVPQQSNENDCGVFVLEYSRCLALSRPFQFSQTDIPKIRKRIYKELCDRKLHEPD